MTKKPLKYYHACLYTPDGDIVGYTANTHTIADAVDAAINMIDDDQTYIIHVYSSTNTMWSVGTYTTHGRRLVGGIQPKHCYLYYGRYNNGRLFDKAEYTDSKKSSKILCATAKKYLDQYDIDYIAVYDLTADAVDPNVGQRLTPFLG